MQPGFCLRRKNSKLLKKRGVPMIPLRRSAALFALCALLCALCCACGSPAVQESEIPPLLLRPAAFAEEDAVVLLDLNTADEAALSSLPGIGPVRAAAIVAYRQEHGPFTSVEELTAVHGIGAATLEKLRPLVTASGD